MDCIETFPTDELVRELCRRCSVVVLGYRDEARRDPRYSYFRAGHTTIQIGMVAELGMLAREQARDELRDMPATGEDGNP